MNKERCGTCEHCRLIDAMRCYSIDIEEWDKIITDHPCVNQRAMTLAELAREVKTLIPDGVFSVSVAIWVDRVFPEYEIWDAGATTFHRGHSPEEALMQLQVVKMPAYTPDEVVIE